MLKFEEGWPPTDDLARLHRYKYFEQLFEADHKTAFADKSAKVPEELEDIIYLILDYPGLISRCCADFLFGEPPVFSVPANESGAEKVQEALKGLVKANNLLPTLYESELSASYRGDTVFYLSVRPRYPGGKPEVIIQERPACYYFVEKNPDNCREIVSEALAWEREFIQGGQVKRALRVEHHVPGRIYNEAFLLDDVVPTYVPGQEKSKYFFDQYKVREHIPLEWLYEKPPKEEVPTKVDQSLLIHVPNVRHGKDYWGVSDYAGGLDTLFDAANGRISKVSEYLDKHTAPHLIIPEGSNLTGPDGNIRVDEIEAIKVDPEIGKTLPRLLTWDGQMVAAYEFLKMIAELIFKFSEISPAVFGEDKAGSIESGRAMKMRFIRTQAKISRKRMYMDPAVKRVLFLALALNHMHFNGPEPIEPQIIWQDGIPTDYTEAVANEKVRLEAGLTTKVAAIRRIDNVSEKEAQAELEAIREEKKEDGPPPPAPGAPPAPVADPPPTPAPGQNAA